MRDCGCVCITDHGAEHGAEHGGPRQLSDPSIPCPLATSPAAAAFRHYLGAADLDRIRLSAEAIQCDDVDDVDDGE